MIDPIIFSFEIFGLEIALRWYGLIIGLAVIAGGYIVEREVNYRGGKGELIWDMLVWLIPVGVIGARLWYVLNSIAGGESYFLDDPGRIFRITEGGLHIYGSIVLGIIVAYRYSKKHRQDWFLLLDSVAPALLIGQALGRPANFINQELYGEPTELPWGIPIAAENRMAAWRDLAVFPEETTRFHPTFAYEMIWNFLAAGLLLWITRKYKDTIKPGTAFFIWLILAGVGRFIIEFFRPDQPTMGDTLISYSRIAATLMAIAGTVLILARYDKIKLAFTKKWQDEYQLKKSYKKKKRRRR